MNDDDELSESLFTRSCCGGKLKIRVVKVWVPREENQ